MDQSYLEKDTPTGGVVNIGDELPLWSAPFGVKLLEAVEYKPGLTALDIGFGSGFPLIELAMRLGESSVVYGIDPWEEACARAREKAELYGVGNVRIMEGVAESIPLDDRSIDLVISNNGINNVDDRKKVLAECARVSRAGGQLVLSLNLDKSMFEFYNCFEQVLAELGLDEEVERMHRHIAAKRPPLDHVLEELRLLGFAVKGLEYDQFNYRFTDGTAMLNHYQIRSGFLNAWVDILPPERAGEVFARVEDALNRQSEINGGMKLSIPFVVVNAFLSSSL
ncbi:MAG: class I SAM-dependent methyltransferase [Bacteroidales bacterium]